MAKRKSRTADEQTGEPLPEGIESATDSVVGPETLPPENGQPATEAAASPVPAEPGAAVGTQAETQPQALVQAPDKGEGRSWTIDNRVGYRKEESPDGRKRQIRFADREGGQRPDDEILAPVREHKPDISYAAREKSWQARKTEEGLEAIDAADQKLAELGRKRTGGQER